MISYKKNHSRILLLGLLYVAINQNLYTQELVNKSEQKKRLKEGLELPLLKEKSDTTFILNKEKKSIVSKDNVLSEFRRNERKNNKLGEPKYKVNPRVYKMNPFKPDGVQEMQTIYDGGRFKQVPRSAVSNGAGAPMPAFIVGGKKEISKKDKKILKEVYGIDVK